MSEWEVEVRPHTTYLWASKWSPGKANSVAIHGPDREANARKFKHMDELVKWAVEFVALEDNALKEWANESLTPWTGNEPCMVRLRALKTILAKIEVK